MSDSTQPLPLLRDMAGQRICQSCKRRYIDPNDIYTKGKRKDEQQDNCRVCRRISKANEFPKHLVLTREQLASLKTQPKLASIHQQWLDSLTLEQTSVLLHPRATLTALLPSMQDSGIPYATYRIHWDAVAERLRDIYLLDRLFVGFEALKKHYKTEVTTIHPIGLLAVSLNNCAVRSDQPCKSCLLSLSHLN